MSRSECNELRPACQSRARGRAALIAFAVVFGAGACAWYVLRDDPERLLARARRDPTNAERLLLRSIAAARGRYPDAERELCSLLARRGDWERAAPLYRALDRARCPDGFLIEFGRAALKSRRWADACDALEEVRRRSSPARVTALPLLATVYFQRQEGRKMLDCLREQARLQPEEPEMWWKLLELLRTRNLDAEYLKTLHEAMSQNLPARDRHELQFKLVSYLVEKGDGAAAQRELDRLVQSEGETPRVKFHRAAIFRMQGEPRQALAILDESTAQIGRAAAVVHLRALINFDLGQFTEAVEGFRQELQDDPFNLTAHFKLAEAYAALDRRDLARRHSEIAVEIRRKRHRINTLKELSKRRPSDVAVCEELSQLYAELNEADESRLWDDRAQRARNERQDVSRPADR